jgi:hypothetical protein
MRQFHIRSGVGGASLYLDRRQPSTALSGQLGGNARWCARNQLDRAATASCYLQYLEVDLSGFRRAWVAN